MGMSRILVVGGLFILGNIIMTDGQVCDSSRYTLLEQPRRSTMAVYDYTSDIPLCDDGLNGALWYRFLSRAGETVVERAANNPVPINRCSTEAPIYIRGVDSHPSIDNTTLDATVCAHYGGNPCQWTETIQIHRCPAQGNLTGYFLYKLKPPPGCSLSYCAGENPPCNQGDYWTGNTCVNYCPPMSGFPLFVGPNTTGSDRAMEVYFTCTVQYTRQANDANARFRVTFLFDGRILEHMNGSGIQFEYLPSFYLTATNSTTQIVLGENYLRGRLGRVISCKADSYWADDVPGNGPTNATMLSQSTYYAAMESLESSYVVNPSHGSNIEIVFRSTLPLTCRHCPTDECCNYNFLMSSEVAGQTCGVKWKSGYTAEAPVYILPSLSQSSISYVMNFKPYIGDMLYNFTSLWHDYIIPPVMVATAPSSTNYKRCWSTNDPYIHTFDGPRVTNTQVGDFYLVRATHSMEVQVRQEVCGGSSGGGSCNCGVIVREGNSAIKISICEQGPWNATVQRSPTVIRLLSQDPVDSSSVYRDGTGRLFSIRMPSGLRVEFDTISPYFDIYVYLPPVYHKNTSLYSMCGNSNGNSGDEITSNLGNFRIESDIDNYFKSQPQCRSNYNPPVTRCDCANDTTGNVKCSNTDDLLGMVSKPQDPLPDRWSTGVVCHQTSKFAATAVLDSTDSDFILDPEVVYPPYSYDPNYGVNVSLTWPTRSNKTEQNVTQYCENMITSSVVYQDCQASVDVAEIITACKMDIQIIDEWLPADSYTSALQEICVNQLAAKVNSSDADSDSTLNTLTSVYEKTCPNQCSGHGTCIKASCACTDGYVGANCGIHESQPPLLTSIIRNGACDVRLRPCDVISVFGSGIISTAPLKCRFTNKNTGSYVETSGTFITSGEYSCSVPGTTTHRRRRAATDETTAITTMDVSMTMNGVVYSNSLPFVLFDSLCMQCNSSATCNQKSDACAINGQCHANEATSANNRCLQCLPETSLSSWTDTTVVQDWEPCTRQCDYGAQSRDKSCNGTMEGTDVELCKATDCPANKDEEFEGVGFTFSEEDLEKILIESDEFFTSIAKALNSYCTTNAVLCCHSVGVSSTSVDSVNYTSPNLTTYASGYPVLTTADTKVKIIVKIDENRLRADCAETEQISSSIVYADTKLIYDAISGAETDIEEDLGVTIVSVWPPEPAQQSTASATCSSLFSMIGIYILLKCF